MVASWPATARTSRVRRWQSCVRPGYPASTAGALRVAEAIEDLDDGMLCPAMQCNPCLSNLLNPLTILAAIVPMASQALQQQL